MQIGEYEESHEIVPKHEPVPKSPKQKDVDMPPPEQDKEVEETWVS